MHLISTHSILDWYILRTSACAFSWTSLLSPKPYWLDTLLVRLHKVYYKVFFMYCAFEIGLSWWAKDGDRRLISEWIAIRERCEC